MDANELKKWVISNNIELDAKNHLNEAFLCYRKEYADEFNQVFETYDQKYLNNEIDRISFSLFNWGSSYDEAIVVSITMYYNDEYVGDYKIEYALTGEILDDSLHIPIFKESD